MPNGVDLDRYTFRSAPASSERVFFVGDLSWKPNAEAVRWFARAVWPILAPARPQAVVDVLGRFPPPDLLALANARFTLTGESADTRPHWRDAAVAVVPLLAGGGTRLKILEAAACGVPVVSTSVGAEGLTFVNGEEILLRDAPERFAEAVALLLADPEARRRQAAAARARVDREYGWRAISARFAGLLARQTADQMTALALALAAVALALGAWSYGLYPPLIRLLAARAAAQTAPLPGGAGASASVEVLVSAADEAAVIAERVRDLLAQDVPGRYTVAIGCDGSIDDTAERARAEPRRGRARRGIRRAPGQGFGSQRSRGDFRCRHSRLHGRQHVLRPAEPCRR